MKGGSMANFWNEFTKWLDDASKVVGKEAGDLTLKGRLKLEIFELSRSLRDQHMKLGMRVYELTYKKKKTEWKTDKEIITIIRKIRRMEKAVRRKQQEYKKIGKKTKGKKKL
jgi:hypothetical protein